jgi:hypothetical protein
MTRALVGVNKVSVTLSMTQPGSFMSSVYVLLATDYQVRVAKQLTKDTLWSLIGRSRSIAYLGELLNICFMLMSKPFKRHHERSYAKLHGAMQNVFEQPAEDRSSTSL